MQKKKKKNSSSYEGLQGPSPPNMGPETEGTPGRLTGHQWDKEQQYAFISHLWVI